MGNRLGTGKKCGITCNPWSSAKSGGSYGCSSTSSTQQRLQLTQVRQMFHKHFFLVLLSLVVLLFLPVHPDSTPSWHILSPYAEEISVCTTEYSISGKLVCRLVLLRYFVTTNNSVPLSSTYFLCIYSLKDWAWIWGNAHQCANVSVTVRVLWIHTCKKRGALKKKLELDISEWKHFLTYFSAATHLFLLP